MWKVTKYSSILGMLVLIVSVFGASSAPQEAAGASIGIGLAIIPYCIARANSEIKRQDNEKEREEDSIKKEIEDL